MPQFIPVAIAIAQTGAIAATAVGLALASAVLTTYSQARARSSSRRAANAQQRDVTTTVTEPLYIKQLVVGKTRVPGQIVAAFKSGVNKEFTHLAIVFADHECETFEEFYFNSDRVTLDAQGWVTTPKYSKIEKVTVTETFAAALGQNTVTLTRSPSLIVAVGSPRAVEEPDVSVPYTQNGNQITFNAVDTTPVSVTYVWDDARPLFKIAKYLGATNQQADSDLIAVSNGEWTAAHRGDSTTYIVMRMEYDHDALSQIGLPSVTAILKGLKCFDPRSNTTAWTDNAAIVSATVLTHPLLKFRATANQFDIGDLIESANVCDEQVPISATESQKRWTVNGLISTAENLNDIRNKLALHMAGSVYWKGKWSIVAGAFRMPEITLTEDDFVSAGSTQIVNTRSKKEKFNTVEGTFADQKNDYVGSTAPAYTRQAYITQDAGKVIAQSVDLPLCVDGFTANRVFAALCETGRRGLTLKSSFRMCAFNIKHEETFLVQNQVFGWQTPKAFVLKDRLLNAEKGCVEIVAVETDPNQWQWNWQNTADTSQAPNSSLADPRIVSDVTGLQVFSAPSYALQSADGTAVGRIKVTWTKHADQSVFSGGFIELQYKRVADAEFTPAPNALGSATESLIGPVEENAIYIVRARAVTGYKVSGDWSHAVIGTTPIDLVPSVPTNFNVVVDSKGLVYAWSKAAFAKRYEIREGSPTGTLVTITDTLRYRTSPRQSGTYQFFIRALTDRDTPGAWVASAPCVVDLPSIAAPMIFELRGGNFEIKWPAAIGPFDIDRYVIKRISRDPANATPQGGVSIAGTAYNWPAVPVYAVSKTQFLQAPADFQFNEAFAVQAVDVAGNESLYMTGGISISGPLPPSNLVFAPSGAVLWQSNPQSLPIAKTESYLNGTSVLAGTASGSATSAVIAIPTTTTGTLFVRSIDTAGIASGFASITYDFGSNNGGS